MTATLTDDEVVVDVDLGATVPCDWEECTAEAVWISRCPSCKHASLSCDVHRAMFDEETRTMPALGFALYCRMCHKPMPLPIPWMPL